jgi:hypothetical protein
MTKRVAIDVDENELLDDTLIQLLSLLISLRNKYGSELFDIALKALSDYTPYAYVASKKAVVKQAEQKTFGVAPKSESTGVATPKTPMEIEFQDREDIRKLSLGL